MKLFVNRRVFRFIVFATLSFLICIMVTFMYITNRSKLENTQMEQLAMSKSNKVSVVLTNLLYKTEILSAFVQQSDGNIQSFDKMASTILDDPSIKNVLLAPNGQVKYVYPVSGNESVYGLDLFSEKDGNKEAALAKETGQLVLGGPFNLVQGGQALVGRLPVYLDSEKTDFWGIASVTLNYPDALAGADLEQLQNQGFAFEIWRISPDTGTRQIIANSEYEYSHNAKYVEYPMDILNAEWYFRLSPIRHWYEFPETWLFLGVGFMISMLIGFLFLHNYDLRNMKHELEYLSLNDSLTGINNRRGGFIYIQQLIDKEQDFVLAYIDLNRFKEINDKHGHSSGDRVLKHFTNLVASQMEHGKHKLARIGGDEFVIIFKTTNDVLTTNEFFESLDRKLSDNKLCVHGESIDISYSKGFACYPNDGDNIDDIIAVADKNMYIAKHNS